MRAWMLLALLNSMHTVGFKLRKCWVRLYQLYRLLFTRCESASLYQTTNSSPGEIFIAGKRHLAHCSCVLWAVPEAEVRQEWSVTLDSCRDHCLGIRTMLLLGRLLWGKAGAGHAFLKLLSIVISKGSLQQPASCLVFVKDIPPFSRDRVHLFCCLFLSSPLLLNVFVYFFFLMILLPLHLWPFLHWGRSYRICLPLHIVLGSLLLVCSEESKNIGLVGLLLRAISKKH